MRHLLRRHPDSSPSWRGWASVLDTRLRVYCRFWPSTPEMDKQWRERPIGWKPPCVGSEIMPWMEPWYQLAMLGMLQRWGKRPVTTSWRAGCHGRSVLFAPPGPRRQDNACRPSGCVLDPVSEIVSQTKLKQVKVIWKMIKIRIYVAAEHKTVVQDEASARRR